MIPNGKILEKMTRFNGIEKPNSRLLWHIEIKPFLYK